MHEDDDDDDVPYFSHCVWFGGQVLTKMQLSTFLYRPRVCRVRLWCWYVNNNGIEDKV